MARVVARSDSGAAAVEFALISVVLFTLIFGIIQYGFYFLQATSVASVANQAGREASLRQDCDEWRSQVAAQVAALGNGAAVTGVLVEPTNASRTTPTRRGDQETVTVTWDPTRLGVIPFPGGDFSEQTVVRYERLDAEPQPSCLWEPAIT